LVKDLGGLSVDDFLSKVSIKFHVTLTKNPEPQRLHQVTMRLQDKWYTLDVKDGIFDVKDPVKCLDVSILQDHVLSPILGIHDPRTDTRIDFVGGIRGTPEIERRCALDAKVGFALYPVPVQQLMDISDSGTIMPPKSTWFEPKLRSGLFVRMLSE
jgi:uncharacterized protein (DUF1015 family)